MSISGISPIAGYSAYGGMSGIYPMYNTAAISGVRGTTAVDSKGDGTAKAVIDGVKDAENNKKVKQAECQTCKNRKYVDGSNESDVSFKAPAHIDPDNAAATVMGHEKEHVANAVAKGREEGNKLLSVSVTLHTSVCPECGRVYVSGGTTHTRMRTSNGEANQSNSNPYAKRQAKLNYMMSSGANFDLTA